MKHPAGDPQQEAAIHKRIARLRATLDSIRREAHDDAELRQRATEALEEDDELAAFVDADPHPESALECSIAPPAEHHGLDNAHQVLFYEQDFYVLSNFSSFTLIWEGIRFDTSEAAYHFAKFPGCNMLRRAIVAAPSAHEAYKIAERNKDLRRPDWDAVKVDIMRSILRAKAHQHEYVRRKLLATGGRELIENSWRDDYWGWGLNRDGQNMLGKLWMEVRAEILQKVAGQAAAPGRTHRARNEPGERGDQRASLSCEADQQHEETAERSR